MEEPFLAGKEVVYPYFFNRKEELKELIRKIDSNTAINIAIYGVRRIGKSSLLLNIKKNLRHTIPVYVKCETMLPKTKISFVKLLIKEINKKYNPVSNIGIGGLSRKVVSKVKKAGVDISNISLWVELGQETEKLDKAIDALFNLISSITKANRKKVVIFLDEFQEVFSFGEDFLWAFRGYISKSNASFIVSSSYYGFQEELTNRKKPFFNFFELYELGKVKDNDAERYIIARAEKFNFRFEKIALDKILNICEGHPFYIQLICSKCYDLLMRFNKSIVDEKIVEIAIDNAVNSLPPHLISEFYKLKGKTREVFVVMCLYNLTSPIEIEKKIGGNNISQILKQIIEFHGLIKKVKQGKFIVIDKFLKMWVKKEFEST